jgi:ABC-2 type transport system ATP-binding protein
MVGGSYGGGIQLVAAATDPRVDAIVPDIAWNSLNSSLYPDNTFKTAYGSLLYLSLLATGARVNSLIPRAILTGDLLGWISESAQATLASSGPTALLNQLQAPTLLTQGIVDVLFPLQQSLISAEAILGNLYNALVPGSVPAKVIWFCGGHGVCSDPISDLQAPTLRNSALAYLEQYVKGTGSAADALPNFQWFDQLGDYYTSDYLPYESEFNDEPDIEGKTQLELFLNEQLKGKPGSRILQRNAKGVIEGTVLASFTVEDFSLHRLASLSEKDLSRRRQELLRLINPNP